MWRDDRHARAPLARKLRWWRHGFRVGSAALYEFPRADPRDYLSDFAALHYLKQLNPGYALFRHKAIRRALLLAAGFPQIETVALVWKRRIVLHPFTPDAHSVAVAELERWLRRDGGPFILKPEDGGGGDKVCLLETDGEGLTCRQGRATWPFGFDDLGHRLTLIERRAESAEFWRGFYPDTLNTMRFLTLWPEGDRAPFIARAVQRMGTPESAPADNRSRGGIFARIDLQTGRLGYGIRTIAGPERFARHPESGAPISGVTLPCWGTIQSELLRAASSLPVNCFAAWDVFLDRQERLVVLEVNGTSGAEIFQGEGGLLADPRVRRYFVQVGVVRGEPG
jgi:hypothetical protein